ncbi:MAG TPA: R3H domain-containing nucleic acid-binding protein [Candidatus Acidoferrales bacterium]|nr:R3H domain-containing nucleic acid-binding protein [Candidatus Acidoferrales bacterium]
MPYRFSAGERLEGQAAAEELRRFLDQVIECAGLDLRYEIETVEPGAQAVERVELRVRLGGPDQDLLLERNAELLQALEYLAVRWLRLDPRLYDHVRLDAADYRALRVEELKLAARVAADRVIATGQPFRFNPMPARERRILHLVLAEIPAVESASEGDGESRQVVVHTAKSRPGSHGSP